MNMVDRIMSPASKIYISYRLELVDVILNGKRNFADGISLRILGDGEIILDYMRVLTRGMKEGPMKK